jgi:hypothetical protein
MYSDQSTNSVLQDELHHSEPEADPGEEWFYRIVRTLWDNYVVAYLGCKSLAETVSTKELVMVYPHRIEKQSTKQQK